MVMKCFRELVATALLLTMLTGRVESADCPSDIQQPTDAGMPNASVTWTPPANHNCNYTSGDRFTAGIVTTVGCTNHTDQCTFTITITDNESPTISGCSDISEDADLGQNTATVTWGVSFNDNVMVTSSECTPSSESVFTVGPPVTVRCTASDAAGNTPGTCTFQVTVVDNQAPLITSCPSGSITRTVGTAPQDRIVTWTVDAVDNVGVTDTICNPLNGSVFNAGSTPVTCTVTDSANNDAFCTFEVSITVDNPPVFTTCPVGPIRKTINEVSWSDPELSVAVEWPGPTATDDRDGKPMLTSSHQPGDKFAVGNTTVTYNATDDAGNTNTSCSFVVEVVYQPPAQVITTSVSRSGNRRRDCIDVKWTRSLDETVNEYSISFWTASQGESLAQNIFVTSAPTTYNSERICGDHRLYPGELYTVKVEAVSGDSRRLISTANQWTKPNTTTNGTVVPGTRTPSSAELSWQGANLENVEQYRVNLADGRDLGYVTKTTNRITVDSLHPDEAHSASVTAVVGSGSMRLESDAESIIIQKVDLYGSGLVAYSFTESSIAVAWKDTGTDDGQNPYMLYIRPEDAEANYLTVRTSYAEFKGLKPNTEYQIRLISNREGLSLSTSQKTRPGRVSNIRPTEVLDNSITLEWDAPAEGHVDSYEVYISPGESSVPEEVTDISYTFSGLTAQTEYFLRIVSVFEDMRSVPQTLMVTAGVTKPAPAPPVNIVALAVGCGLGAFAIILIVGIIVMCRKYRKLKADRPTGTGYERRIQQPCSGATTSDGGYQASAPGLIYENATLVKRLGDKLSRGKPKTTVPMVPVKGKASESSEYALPNPLG